MEFLAGAFFEMFFQAIWGLIHLTNRAINETVEFAIRLLRSTAAATRRSREVRF